MVVAVVVTDLVPMPVRSGRCNGGQEGRETADCDGKGQEESLGFHEIAVMLVAKIQVS
jgi:hypothetical protein